jgi:hypothetical protein
MGMAEATKSVRNSALAGRAGGSSSSRDVDKDTTLGKEWTKSMVEVECCLVERFGSNIVWDTNSVLETGLVRCSIVGAGIKAVGGLATKRFFDEEELVPIQR